MDPPIPEKSTLAIPLWESLGFAYNTTTNDTKELVEDNLLYNYIGMIVIGRNSTTPGDGGDGGVGGIGGYAGTSVIVGLKGQPNFAVVANRGKFNFKRLQFRIPL